MPAFQNMNRLFISRPHVCTLTSFATLTFAASAFSAVDPSLSWHLDETGSLPVAVDSNPSPTLYAGTSAGNVIGGAVGALNGAYSGFSNTGSYVYANFGGSVFGSRSFTFLAMVANPNLTASSKAMIARGVSNPVTTGNAGNVPWQLWIDGNTGSIKLGVQNWNGGNTVFTSDTALTWSTDTWYQVALTCSFSTVSGIRHQIFDVYVTATGSTSVTNVLHQDYYAGTSGNSPGLANAQYLQMGGGLAGYYSASAPSGYFGGQIDEVNYWINNALTAEELSARLTQIPEPASLGLLSMASLVVLCRKARK